MNAMMRRSAWLHWLLSAYLWLISWIPLGNWNRLRESTLLQALLSGRGAQAADLGMLAFSSGITQNRPVRVTSKPANGEGSGH